MTAPTLTEDQRWLLRSVGGWAMRECLISSGGVMRLMQSMYGSTGHVIEGGPAWLAGGFSCGQGKVVSPGFGEPVVTVTVAQINRYAASLPDELKADLVACRDAQQAEAKRTWKWCHCGREADCLRSNAGDPQHGRRYHPAEAEVQAHYGELARLNDWQDNLLDRALGFEVIGEPVGQLELFEVA